MLKAELLEIIANGENSGVEFKRDDIRPEQLAKEIVAFANGQGGRIILGVEDNGQFTGLQSGDMIVTDLGQLQTAPKVRTRVEWDVAISIMMSRSAARLRG